MKTRESGMPERELWDTFFEPNAILTALGLTESTGNTVDFGCGYGTFAIPAAQRIAGTLYGFDIEDAMIVECSRVASEQNLDNTRFIQRDFVDQGTGLPECSVDFVMLCNILHAREADRLLEEAMRVLRPGGLLGVIHWNYDPATPRGPSMAIRPRPEECRKRIQAAGFQCPGLTLDLKPYHFGLVGIKPSAVCTNSRPA